MDNTIIGEIYYMENKSLWLRGMRFNKNKPIEKNESCDILIIGGGMAGLNTAYFLMNKGYKIILVDKNTCGKGISAYTTGKLTYMQELNYHKIKENYNDDIAYKYLESQKDAIRLIKGIINKNNIDCNLDSASAYVFTNEIDRLKDFKKEESFYLDHDIKYKEKNMLPIKIDSLYNIKTNFSYVFHPVKYMLSLKKILLNNGVIIYEDSLASLIEKRKDRYYVKVNDSYIDCTYLVVASHYPFFIKPGFIPFKTSVERSYVVSGIVNKYKKIEGISYQKEFYSFRYHLDKKSYFLLGSGSHMVNDLVNSASYYQDVLRKYKNLFNDDIKYYWTNHDILTYDRIPLIGRVNDKEKNFYIMTGFNTWGMTNSVLGGKIISDLILEKENPYIELFNPKRKISMDKIKNILVYGLSSMKSYTLSKLNKNHSFYKENVLVISKNNKVYGIYIDKKGNRHVVNNTCPHMGCSLIFNYTDKTWDCPCHASRYDIDGNILYGPSTFNIKVDDFIDRS